MTVWVRFAEDSSLPATMDAEARRRFESVFDVSARDSAFSLALARLRLKGTPPRDGMVRWHGDTPYINWSHLVALLSAGMAVTELDADGRLRYKTALHLLKLPAFIASQWRITRYILQRTEPDFALPEDAAARISESLSLGLTLLALSMRLPSHTPAMLAGWLANPSQQNPSLQKILHQMQRLQQLRTRLSGTWQQWFPGAPASEPPRNLPEFFQDQPPFLQEQQTADTDTSGLWQGIGVCGSGPVTGRAVLVTRHTDRAVLETGVPVILIFPLARPESVEWYEARPCVLFGEGGVMSHACTVAREMGLPCITALGKPFIRWLKGEAEAGRTVWLCADPQTGTVRLHRNAD